MPSPTRMIPMLHVNYITKAACAVFRQAAIAIENKLQVGVGGVDPPPLRCGGAHFRFTIY